MKDLANLPEDCRIELPESLLSDKIFFLKFCNLREDEFNLFQKSLKCIEKYMIDNRINIPEDIFPINICFVEDREQIIVPLGKTSYGSISYTIIYNMTLIRNKELPDFQVMTVFLEELAHHFLFCKNEVDVKHLVYNCLKYEYLSLSIGNTYGKEVLNE